MSSDPLDDKTAPGAPASPEHERGFRQAWKLRDEVASDPYWQAAYDYAARYRLSIDEINALGPVLVPRGTADPVRPQETLRERVAQALHDWRCLRACKGYEYHSEKTKNFYRNEADGVLPIVEEETARQADLIAEFRKRDESASRVIRNAIRQAAEHGTELAALRDKVKALADELKRLAVVCAAARVAGEIHYREAARRLDALVEEPQGGEGQ